MKCPRAKSSNHCLTELFSIYQNKHWTIRRRDNHIVVQSSHLNISKIDWLLVLIMNMSLWPKRVHIYAFLTASSSFAIILGLRFIIKKCLQSGFKNLHPYLHLSTPLTLRSPHLRLLFDCKLFSQVLKMSVLFSPFKSVHCKIKYPCYESFILIPLT